MSSAIQKSDYGVLWKGSKLCWEDPDIKASLDYPCLRGFPLQETYRYPAYGLSPYLIIDDLLDPNKFKSFLNGLDFSEFMFKDSFAAVELSTIDIYHRYAVAYVFNNGQSPRQLTKSIAIHPSNYHSSVLRRELLKAFRDLMIQFLSNLEVPPPPQCQGVNCFQHARFKFFGEAYQVYRVCGEHLQSFWKSQTFPTNVPVHPPMVIKLWALHQLRYGSVVQQSI